MLTPRAIARWATVVCAGLLLVACAAAPPKPAMVPLGQTGDFGYSERDVGPDRIEVTYTGANIRVSSTQGRNDSRVSAEHQKTRDLALWRAAQIADERGMEALKIESETRDTDLQVTQQYVQPPFYGFPHYGYPYYGYPYYRRFCCGLYSDDYYIEPVRRAYAQSVSTLTVLLIKTRDPNDATQLSVKDTLAKLQASRSSAAY